MRVAVFQTNPILLDVKTNVEGVVEKIRRGKEKGAELMVFPELALTGYFVNSSYHKAALKMDSPEIKKIVDATKGTAAIVGFIEESKSMNFYNAALVAVDGEARFAYRKLNLPNYGVFEERKFFSNGKQVTVFKLNDFNVGVFICNDMWHPAIPYLGVTQKADIFVTLFNSSQGSMASEFSNIESWEIINKFYSRVFGIYNIAANRVGSEALEDRRDDEEDDDGGEADNRDENDIVFHENYDHPRDRKYYRFWGGSEIINPFGQQIYRAALYEEDEIIGDISKDLLRKKKIILPYLRNDDPFFTFRELDRILFQKDGIKT